MDPITIGIIAAGALALLSSSKSTFRYVRKNGEWRAYFRKSPPSYEHVLRDGDGYYVCWDRPVKSEADARHISKLWLERYGA